MSEFPFFPFSFPTHTDMIELPQEITGYKTLTYTDDQTIEKQKTVEIDIDWDRVSVRKDKQNFIYSTKELKKIAKFLGIKGAGSMNKENLVKYIRLKRKK